MTTLVDLVKAGVLGFAVAIMLLAYFALRNLTSQLNAPTAALALIAREIRIFMGLSLAVVALGIGWELINPKIQVSIDVSPRDIAGYDVRVSGESIKLPEAKNVSLQKGNQIVLELIKFEREIHSLHAQIEGLKEQTKLVRQAQQIQATTETQRTKESGL